MQMSWSAKCSALSLIQAATAKQMLDHGTEAACADNSQQHPGAFTCFLCWSAVQSHTTLSSCTFGWCRFAGNPYVTGPPYLRFYAGAPLIDSNGYRIGALCVWDMEPREFDAENANVLCNFAEVVVRELEKDKLRVGIACSMHACNGAHV